jgi:isopenicillin-N epimerase
MALSPTSVLHRIQKEKELYELNPTDGLFNAWGRMWDVQKKLAQFLKADPKNLYLRANVTVAMSDYILALKLPAQSEILVSDIEYGAIAKICQYKAETENFGFKTFSLHERGQKSQTITEDQLLERLEHALTPRTKLVMLSHVMTGAGLRLPIEKMARLLRSKNIFFAVDGAHGAGSCDLDFSKTEVDFYGSNLHKWLMGPKGSGFAYVAPRMREYLQPRFAGWTTGEVPPHFAVFGDGDEWTTRWMICSTHNFSDFYGIHEMIHFWQEQGPEKIMTRQKQLADFSKEKLGELTGWECRSDFPTTELRGPLVAFALPSQLQEKGFALVPYMQNKKNIVITTTFIQGDWHLRISPHVYNTEDEITEAAEVLSKLNPKLI